MLMGQKKISSSPENSQSKVILFIFAFAVFLLPIDWVSGIRVFGEFSIMSSFYVFLPLVMIVLPFVVLGNQKKNMEKELWWFTGLMLFAFFISCAFNISDILSASLKERSGLHKVVTTFITFYFGVALMFVTANLSRCPDFLKTSLFKPVSLSLLLVFFVCMIELAGWFSGTAQDIYLMLSKVFRSGYVESNVNDGRLRGVSGEPAREVVLLCWTGWRRF